MARKDACDICGTGLDDDAVIQEFPDGSVVKLCAECAAATPPEEDLEFDDDYDLGEPTQEWSDNDDDPTAAAPPHFKAEDFDLDDQQPQRPPIVPPPGAGDGSEEFDDGASKAAAELAAWANAPAEDEGEESAYEEDEEAVEDYDEEDAEKAALRLAAAIQEADMAEEGEEFEGDELEGEGHDSEAAYQSEAEEELEGDAEYEAEAGLEAEAAGAAEAEEAEAEADLGDAAGFQPPAGQPQPVTDLLALQTEMQSALARLSSTLEHFVSDLVANEERSSAMSNRLQTLEDELESTRERLRAAESLLPESSFDAVAAIAAASASSDSDLLGAPPAPAPAAGPAVTPPPPLPPLPPLPTAPAETGKKKTGPVPPPVNVPTLGGAAMPPSLPPLPPLPGAGPGLVPPPLAAGVGLAAGAAVVAGAALVAGAVPPPPPLPGLSAPAPAKAPPVTKPPVDELAPTPRVKKQPPPQAASPAAAASAAPKAPPAAPAPAAPASKPAQTPAATAPLPAVPAPAPEAAAAQTAPHAHSVGGAAAAMQKLLRGRKGHHQPEPEPEFEAEPQPEEQAGLTFSIGEVQVAQRFFNESEFVKKVSEISKSIGRPRANVSRSSPGAPEAAITIFWDIVWYQYLVDLRKEIPAGEKRVIMAQEGMDLEELEPRFTEKNATINDDGRLDASELEVRLLSDPEALITEMELPVPSQDTRLADDATEEIWDQQSAPEFRWD